MKKPDLFYNNYFPFYTREIIGDKKYCYGIQTTMHISRELGILISASYTQKKPDGIYIKRITDSARLFNARIKGSHIAYVDFAKEVNTAFWHISEAVRILSPEPAYRVIFVALSNYLKFNTAIELKVDHWGREIYLHYGKFEYKIIEGKKVKSEQSAVNDGSEESLLMQKLNAAVRVIEDHRTYQEVSDGYFQKQLDDEWNYFIEYFKAPKCIRKNEYRL